MGENLTLCQIEKIVLHFLSYFSYVCLDLREASIYFELEDLLFKEMTRKSDCFVEYWSCDRNVVFGQKPEMNILYIQIVSN